MDKQKSIELYRTVVPESNYKECKGCHTGSGRCIAVHKLHTTCPCKECIVKTSCTDYCDQFLYSVRMASARHLSPGRIRVEEYSHKGYVANITYRGKKIRVTNRLWRYMDSNTKKAILAGYSV